MAAGRNEPSSGAKPADELEPVYTEDDENEANTWLRVPRADWRREASFSQKPSAFFRPVAAARLAAIATLRKNADEAVQRAKPRSAQELERCLWPPFVEYAIHLFDQRAETKLKLSAGGRLSVYRGWLKSQCLPAVVEDLCKPILGQFPITVRYLAEMISDVDWPRELADMRRALWKMYADEVLPGPFTESLSKRVAITIQEQRIPHWEAEAIRVMTTIRPKRKSKNHSGQAATLEILREAMDQGGLNPGQLARKMRQLLKNKKGNRLKADRSTIYRIMKGVTTKPNPEMREALIEALQLTEEKASVVRGTLAGAKKTSKMI